MSYKRKNIFKCELCDYSCGNGYLINHIKIKHHMLKDEYLKLYPDAKFYTDEYLKQRYKRISAQMNLRWKDEKYREKMQIILTNNARNPEVRKAMQIGRNKLDKRFHTEEYKKQESIRMKEKWKDKNYRKNQHDGIMKSPKRFKSEATKQKISEAITELWEKGVYTTHNHNSFSYRKEIYLY